MSEKSESTSSFTGYNKSRNGSITGSPSSSNPGTPRVKKALVVTDDGDAADLNKVVEITFDQSMLMLSGSTFQPEKLMEYIVRVVELVDKNIDLTGPEKKAVAVRVIYMLIDKFIPATERDMLKLLVGSAIEAAISLSKGNHDINSHPPLSRSDSNSSQTKRVNCCTIV